MFPALKMLVVFLTLGSIVGAVGIPYAIIVGNTIRLYSAIMRVLSAGVRAAGIRVEVTGRENVPSNVSCIFLSNHVSNLDPPVLVPQIPGMASVLLKKELMSIPLLGTAMRLGSFIPVERGHSREAAQRSVTAAAQVLRSGLHILIFPEGTRSRDGRLAAFKRGPFFLAKQTGAPIVPVAISGTQTMMRKGSVGIVPGIARVQMLAPIYPAEYTTREALMIAVRSAIANALPEEMQPVSEAPQAVPR